MGYLDLFAISAAGMDVERLRVEVASMNLANAYTISSANGPSYVPRMVVARPAPMGRAHQSGLTFFDHVEGGLVRPEAIVQPTGQPERRVMDPGHPMADAEGFVRYPGIDTTTEMFTIMSAVRAYEANLAAVSATRAMALKALDLGGSL